MCGKWRIVEWVAFALPTGEVAVASLDEALVPYGARAFHRHSIVLVSPFARPPASGRF